MKIVIIGGSGHIGYALNGIERNPEFLDLCAFAQGIPGDMTPETANRLNYYFKAESFDDWRNMLDVIEPDVAVIATRYDMNGVISLECLKRGINCFTEKTIAHSLELLDELEKTAAENNVRIIGMHGMRYTPGFYAAFKAFEDGAIGDAIMLYGRKSYHFDSTRPDFYRHRKTYGGTVLWVAVHAIDWFCWFCGHVTEISAAQTIIGNRGYNECESAVTVSMRFANDAIGTISADFLRPKNAGPGGDDQLRIAGGSGIIEVRNGKAILTSNETHPHELPLQPEGDFFGDFCRSIDGMEQCRLTMEDTFMVSRAALYARESADKHKIIKHIK